MQMGRKRKRKRRRSNCFITEKLSGALEVRKQTFIDEISSVSDAKINVYRVQISYFVVYSLNLLPNVTIIMKLLIWKRV